MKSTSKKQIEIDALRPYLNEICKRFSNDCEKLNENKAINEISDIWHVGNTVIKLSVRTTTFWSSTFNAKTSFLLGLSALPQLAKFISVTVLDSLSRTWPVTLYRRKQTEHMLFDITCSASSSSSPKDLEAFIQMELPLLPIIENSPMVTSSLLTVNENGCLDISQTESTRPPTSND